MIARFSAALVLAAALFGSLVAAQQTAAALLAREAVLDEGPLLQPAMLAELNEADAAHLDRYLARRSAFVSRLSIPPDGEAAPLHGRRVAIESAIVSLLDREGIEESAADVARALDLARPGQERPVAAGREAASAEAYLRAHPGSPAAPYLYAFVASRHRLALEASTDATEKERFARRYRTMADRLRQHPDGLVALLARGLDSLPSLGGGPAEHPRDYLPPG
jgi:hypothetical protein